MVNPRVSIITVVKNGERTIEQTIRSVAEQSYGSIEYIIIDDNSTDGTGDIIKKYSDSISIYIREDDKGIYDAMNKGIKAASGEIIGIINSDDWYEKDAIKNAVGEFTNDEASIDIVCGQGNIIKNGEVIGRSHKDSIEKIWYYFPFMHPAVFVRNSVYKERGAFDTGYRIAADYDLLLRFYTQGVRFKIVDQLWVNFRAEGISCTERIATAVESQRVRKMYAGYSSDEASILEYGEKKIDEECYNEAIERNDGILEIVLSEYVGRKVCIFGCGRWGREIGEALDKIGYEVEAFIDNDNGRWGKTISGCPVNSPCYLGKGKRDVVIAIMDKSDEVVSQIEEIGNPDLRYVTIGTILKDIRTEVLNRKGISI